MMALSEFCDMIDTYGGRDKVMKGLCYSAKLIAGLQLNRSPELSKKFAIFSSKLSGARATLRLIDDVPMIQYALEYGLGEKEPDRIMSFVGLIANIVDLIYYPIEKICWLSEHNILNLTNADDWNMLSSFFWVISIYLNLMRTMRNITIMEQHKKCENNLNNSKEILEKVAIKRRMEVLSILRLSLDFTHAVSTLPKGYLWGGKLQMWQVGLIGTTSAALGTYQYIKKKQLSK